ncbi:MAG: iron chelate uptake ABC transporter family permease subunit, partial [Kocuria sp.]|nr:iron chelate uptake ABC transporter family permease subunit [Kocuria sp.]
MAWPVLVGCLLVAFAVSVAVGTRPVDLTVTWSVLPHAVTGDTQSVTGIPALDAAVVESRVWRTVAGVLTGAALAVAGALLQGATRNPLGDPGILGLTAGAACAVVMGAVLGGLISPGSQLWLAALGSGMAKLLVYGLAAAAKGGASPVTLALTGAA